MNKDDIDNKNEISTVTDKKRSVNFSLIEVIVIILMTSIVVATATSLIVYKNYNKLSSSTSTTKTNGLVEIQKAYNNILNSYVEKVDENELANAAINGMYSYLGDPYTSYLDDSTTSDLMDRLNGEYYGIGIEFSKSNNGFVILKVFDDSPAARAELFVGDLITKIDNEDVTSRSSTELAKMIKSNVAKTIKITVSRGTISLTKDVTLSNVTIPTVESHNFNGIGYIKISTFASNTDKQFSDTLEKLEKEGINGLVIDVRGNGGGYLTTASKIAELFIEKGKNIYGLQTQYETKYHKDETSAKRDYKIVVLTNTQSASASEILAAALRESYGAKLVGTKTYGKGTVQDTDELSSGGMVKYTTAYWLTPNGNNINETGLVPDIEVNAIYKSGINYDDDLQLQQALNEAR